MTSEESQVAGESGEDNCKKPKSVGGSFRIVGVPRWKTEQKGCSNVLGRAWELVSESLGSVVSCACGEVHWGSRVATLE